jgi:hypothetical protein
MCQPPADGQREESFTKEAQGGHLLHSLIDLPNAMNHRALEGLSAAWERQAMARLGPDVWEVS